MANDDGNAFAVICCIFVLPFIGIPMSIVAIIAYNHVDAWPTAVCQFGNPSTVYDTHYTALGYGSVNIKTLASFDTSAFIGLNNIVTYIAAPEDFVVTGRKLNDVNATYHPVVYGKAMPNLFALTEQQYANWTTLMTTMSSTSNTTALPTFWVEVIYPPPNQDLNLKTKDQVKQYLASISGKNMTCYANVPTTDVSKLDQKTNYQAVTENTAVGGWIAFLVISLICLVIVILVVAYIIYSACSKS